MCKHGTDVLLEVIIPAGLSYTGKARKKIVGIDACIAPLVKALNNAGFTTVASCCGHGKRPGNIALADGRELIIAKDFEEGRKIDALFPVGIDGMTQEEREADLIARTETQEDQTP